MQREIAMAYFSRVDDKIKRGAKLAADIFIALMLLIFCIAFFGYLGGFAAFVVVEAGLIGVDYFMANHDDRAAEKQAQSRQS